MRIDNVMASPEDIETTLPKGASEATPEEQEAYERVVMAGMKALYDPGSHEQMMALLEKGAADPAKALASVAQTIIGTLDDQSKGTIPETVIIPAAVEILEHTGELADAASLFPVDEAVLNRAGQELLIGLGEQYGVGPEEIQDLLSSFPESSLNEMAEQQNRYAEEAAPAGASPDEAAPAEAPPAEEPAPQGIIGRAMA